MSEKKSLKWHEIILESEQAHEPLPFIDLFREYADAVKEREAKKKAEAFWPYPRP